MDIAEFLWGILAGVIIGTALFWVGRLIQHIRGS